MDMTLSELEAPRRKQSLPSSASGSFLKWVGGKTRYAKQLSALAPKFSGTYREPFMGSAAVFFEMQPPKAVLTDANAELVHAFRAVQRDPVAVMDLLDGETNTRERYLEVRSQNVEALDEVERGARLIYLNKTAFRGLWRVNRKGQMNVPYGEYARPLYNSEMILACSAALAGVEIRECDFETALDEAGAGDFVYVDPPYVPLGGFSDFKRYTPGQFHDDDHERLAAAMSRASARGALVLMTNSDTPAARSIFRDFELTTMATRRDVNLNAKGRASTDLLASNYELPLAETLF